MQNSKNYKIGYYLVTDIQHIPPMIRLYPYLGGVVFCKRRDIYEHIKEKYADQNIEVYHCKNRRQAQRMIREHRIRVMIYPSYHVLYGAKAVEIFHGGLSDKNYVESVKILVYDYVLFPGEKTKDKVDRSGYLRWIPRWDIIGYPKFDPLLKKTLDVKPLFNNGRKTVLYAPTWISQNVNFKMIKFSTHGESSLDLWGKAIVRALHKDVNLIIKYHSRIYRKPGDIYEQIDSLIKELGAEDKVKISIDDNILPYMAQADLMISDISTACYEWFHFDRPIVFANPSPEHYIVSEDIGSNTYAWQAGDVFGREEDILPHVMSNLDNDLYNDKRNEIFKYTVFQPDGHATERQAKAIIDFYKKYENIPYSWLLLTTTATRRCRRSISKFMNWWYQKFDKSRIGK
ncbi:CDP-glycerol glycerophosphotransferase family protein [bacterium]|nr:CDP-glycerol glycerophosphotransferase family protein [bacterium]